MQVDFFRTLGALRTDRSSGMVIGGVVAIALLGAWILWFFGASVVVYSSSIRARVEVFPSPAQVAAPVSGRITSVQLLVGKPVEAGEILVELDATAEQISLERARGAVAAIENEAASVARELVAEDAGSVHSASSDREGVREVIAHQQAAKAALTLAEEEERRIRALLKAGAASEADLSKAVADLHERQAALQALVHEADALGAGSRQRESARSVRREQLERQRGHLEAQLAQARAEVARLENERERRRIRAPIAGTLGQVASLQPGAVVTEGTIVGTVVPAGTLQVVAEYGPESVGRIVAGQRGRLRLDGLPWTQYGTVALEVARVASEPREGTVRVELALAASRIAVHHGMTGSVDINVEQTTPLALLLRATGTRHQSTRK